MKKRIRRSNPPISRAMGHALASDQMGSPGGISMAPPVLQLEKKNKPFWGDRDLMCMRDCKPSNNPEKIKAESIQFAKGKKDAFLASMLPGLKTKSVDPQVPLMIHSGGGAKKPYRIAFDAGKHGRKLLEHVYGARSSVLNEYDEANDAIEIIYENDGSGINPGGGTDQGPTAKLALYYHRRKKGKSGHYTFGATLIDMHTPVPNADHQVPEGKEKFETFYNPKDKGPYSGIAAVHFGVTYYKKGGWTLNFMQSLGMDDPKWGKKVQDLIHKKVSNSPLFPWQGDRKLYAETGISASKAQQFEMMDVKGRFIFTGGVKAGTRGIEGDIEAKMQIDMIQLKGHKNPALVLEAGVAGNAHLRGNDGREVPQAGLEAGFVGGLRMNLGKNVSLFVSYRDMLSTDPVKQSLLERGDRGWGQRGPISGSNAGSHKTGSVKLIVRF